MLRDTDLLLPKPLHDDSDWMNLMTKIKEYYNEYALKIKTLRYSLRPDITNFPLQLADSTGAIYKYHGDVIELRKVLKLMPSIQRKPLVFSMWKPLIDDITGGDSRIWHGNILQRYFQIEQSLIEWKDYMVANYINLSLDTTTGFIVEESPIEQVSMEVDTIQSYDSADLTPVRNGYILIDLNGVGITGVMLDKVELLLAGINQMMFVCFIGETVTVGLDQYFEPSRQII